MAVPIGIRWTIGDVSPAGFEALRLSIEGAVRLFGPEAAYVVGVNTIAVAEAKRRVGKVPRCIGWRQLAPDIPEFLRPFLDGGMAEGVAWKLLPLRMFPDRYELALDNDVILWAVPSAVRTWLEGSDWAARVIAADVTLANGQFAEFCGAEPLNSGIRGIGPGFDLEQAMKQVLRCKPVLLESELDEQGLQIAALSREGPPLVIPLDDVNICSPFYPHTPELGCCGAHFVGLNAREIPWRYYDRSATEVRLEHWIGCRQELYQRVQQASRLSRI